MQAFFSKILHGLKRAAWAVLPPIALASLCAGIVWNTIHGDRGSLAQERVRATIEERQTRLAQLNLELRELNERNAMMGDSGPGPDRDMLDERARQLGLQVGRDELVFPYEPSQRLAPAER